MFVIGPIRVVRVLVLSSLGHLDRKAFCCKIMENFLKPGVLLIIKARKVWKAFVLMTGI